jgi:hypothetical protein
MDDRVNMALGLFQDPESDNDEQPGRGLLDEQVPAEGQEEEE